MIGYTPYSTDLSAPGDRRRFGFYAKSKNLQFEIANIKKKYDIVYVTSSANISAWIKFKQNNRDTKIIFEIIDAYNLKDNFLWNIARGIFRFLSGRENRLYLYYNNIYKRIFRIADAVVCSTQAQKDFILKYNKNVHISVDYFDDDISFKKTDYTTNKPFILIWEGLSFTVRNILTIKSVLEKFKNIHLKIITNPKIPIIWNLNRKTETLFKDCKFSYEIIPWEKNSFSNEISKGDLAIIPINVQDKLHYYKPANKLILLWKIGIPVITTSTPAYKKLFSEIDIDLTCYGDSDWTDKLHLFTEGKIDIKEHMSSIKKFLDKNHNKEKIIKNWDEIFLSI